MADEENNSIFSGASVTQDPVEVDSEGNIIESSDQNDTSSEENKSTDNSDNSEPVPGSDTGEGEDLIDLNDIKDPSEEDSEDSDEDKDKEPSQEEEGDDESKDGEDKGSSQEDDSSSSETPPALGKLVETLQEEGILSEALKDEEGNPKEINSTEDLLSTFKEEVDSRVEEYKNSLDENTKDLAEAMEEGVPLEEYKNSKSRENIYTSISEEDITGEDNKDVQKKLLKRDFLDRGYSEDRADKFIERLEDSEDLEEEAKRSLGSLQESEKKYQEKLKEETRERRKEEEKKREEQIENFKENVKKTEEIIPGIKLSQKEKDELINMVTSPNYDEQGNPVKGIIKKQQEDPYEFEKRLNYFYKQGFFDKDADLSKIKKTQKTKASGELKEQLEKQGDEKAGKPHNPKKSSEDSQDPEDIASKIPNL